MAVRFFLLSGVFLVLFGLLGANLFHLQIQKGEYYFAKAEARSEFQAALDLRRGEITVTDRTGKRTSAALNRDYPVILASPKDVEDAAEAAALLSPLIGWEEEELKEILSNKESLFRLLVERAESDELRAVEELNLKGIYIDQKQYRSYQFDDLAAQLIGFVGVNDKYDEPVGLYGLEREHDDDLKDGGNVNLTIDINLQSKSEELLKELVEKFSAEGGSIIIEEPKTGKIIAMASAPGFNPNDYGASPVKNFTNPVVQAIYEPGSVFKPITMAAGIDLGVITPTSTYYDSGKITLNGKTIENWDHKAYGQISMTRVIERSVNTGAVFAESKIGHDNFYEYLKKFGFGQLSNVDLPDETRGSLKNLENKNARAIDFATASFGQGTAVTPIQIINAFSVLANGGVLMRPYVSASLEPEEVRRVINEDTAQKVMGMMESAVREAAVASIPNYRVAGKTGTAQVPDFVRGGYGGELIHTFIGFAPVSNPRFVIMIKLDKPQSPLAGQTVVPAFRELAEYVLNYYQVPPDNLTTNDL
ncbi:MAG: Peptidoglycan glycosyltransferase [Candidatus Jorgensenbacteria bacterium GW2011_GWA1_48_13]|uniref:Peptidoglycan glycosyltransferase n=2 Tax=Candidatus Joergenseniibacteriota TaxID=1752739 RepID=A0A0G1Z833_9BACT|nr:MAG: Peptidoglycan glycosyltransferase [Candidatus Jorgensenbacteria bacterium GW2011_GWA1_48_13]KKU98649.1 MAG: Peptidoglycan glycosyltransferase [Candidatus Jorgensenbacteria bacterium GW2011_GWC1_48_8]KKW15119.1 MAG: Peptidoglycan glycosyltransferase [Candidatus Jorgensenbacteria bacterium GW2011_GWB1_50_10]